MKIRYKLIIIFIILFLFFYIYYNNNNNNYLNNSRQIIVKDNNNNNRVSNDNILSNYCNYLLNYSLNFSKLEFLINYVNDYGRTSSIHSISVLIASNILRDEQDDDIINYLETGTQWGFSLLFLCESKFKYINMYGIDLFEKNEDFIDDLNITTITQKIKNYCFINNKIINLNLYKINSHDINSFKNKDLKINLLYIDGDHSYFGVVSDFYYYSKYLVNNSIIIFDDYNYIRKELIKAVDDIYNNNNKNLIPIIYKKMKIVF